MKKSKVLIVMPAYNAAKTLKATYDQIPKVFRTNVLLVDDASHDQTVKLAKQLNLKVVVHQQNLGYGGNQKTCYQQALLSKADIIVLLHPDYQYDPKYIKYLIQPISDGYFDIMLGSRLRSRLEALKNGMPLYKYLANRMLTFLENICLGLNLSEYHTGFRAYHQKVLKKINFNKFSDDFVFDQQILIVAHLNNFKIGEIFAPAFYRDDSSSIGLLSSIKYGIDIIKSLLVYLASKLFKS